MKGTCAKAAVPASIAGILTVISMYAVQRAVDVFLHPAPNPAAVAWSAHIAMFWRLATGGYAGGLVAFVVFFVSTRQLVWTTKVLAWAVPAVAALIAVQGILLP